MDILVHPITALILCLILGAIAVSGKFSQHAANFLLMLAWGVGVFAVMRSGLRDFRLLGIGVCAITAIGLFISWWIRPSPKARSGAPTTSAEAPPTPSLVFVFGVPLGDNDSASWMMVLKHYGSSPAHNCRIDFYDQDRVNIQHEWLLKHANSPYPPPGLTSESRKQVSIVEATPEGSSGGFIWSPLYPDSQHYTVNIDCRAGVFTEKWEVTRVDGILRSSVTIERGAQWTAKNPDKDPVVFKLADPEFVSTPLATEMPKAPKEKLIHPGWKPNHRFEVPAAILDPNGNLQVMSGIKLPNGSMLTDFGCWNILTRHYGDTPAPPQ